MPPVHPDADRSHRAIYGHQFHPEHPARAIHPALRLVQMAAGGSLAEAAAFLGIDHRYLKASPGSAAFADNPAEFRLAVHALARQLSTTPHLVNYKNRRDALQDWCIDPGHGKTSSASSPPAKGPFQPELSNCKRQFASGAVWARITQGEHLMAPRIIENQMSAGDPAWHRRRGNPQENPQRARRYPRRDHRPPAASCPAPRPRCSAGRTGRGLRSGRRLPGLRHLDILISLWRKQQEPAAAGPRTWC
jgi:hypothetical protein